jgi:hypothetical protein
MAVGEAVTVDAPNGELRRWSIACSSASVPFAVSSGPRRRAVLAGSQAVWPAEMSSRGPRGSDRIRARYQCRRFAPQPAGEALSKVAVRWSVDGGTGSCSSTGRLGTTDRFGFATVGAIWRRGLMRVLIADENCDGSTCSAAWVIALGDASRSDRARLSCELADMTHRPLTLDPAPGRLVAHPGLVKARCVASVIDGTSGERPGGRDQAPRFQRLPEPPRSAVASARPGRAGNAS